MTRTPKRLPKRSVKSPRGRQRALLPPAPPPGTKLATPKGQRTYERIVAAAIDSFVEVGYARTSMSSIAERAGLTRSRVQYYFASTEQLLGEATQALLARVWDRYFDRLYAPATPLDAAFDQLMALRKDPEHIAWMELVVASRTDPMLRRIVEHAQRQVDRRALDVQRRLLAPETPADVERMAAIADIVRLVLEGLTLSVIGDAPDHRIERALRALKSMLASYWGRPLTVAAG